MQRYIYAIALRVWHPDIDLRVVSEELDIEASHSWAKGSPRRTPTGSRLEGCYEESYWHSDLHVQGKDSRPHQNAETILIRILARLKPHSAFLTWLHSEGATTQLTLSSFGKRNYAVVLSPELLSECAALSLSMVHDVYPYEQNW